MQNQGAPKGFQKAKERAEKLLGNKEKLKNLIASAGVKASRRKEQIKGVWEDFQILLRLIKAWRTKAYNQVPWQTITYAVAAILYFVNPLDLIPDFIPLSGLVDDLTMITFVIKSIQSDLDKFKEWEKERPNVKE